LIVDKRRGYILIHVPKTGGQSISRALGGKTKGIPTHDPFFAHARDGLFSFGLARNPWDRMVSLYCFLCQKKFKQNDRFDQKHVRSIGFKRWLLEDSFYMGEDESFLRRATRGADGDGYLKPMQRRTQLYWLEGVDYIGCYENLQSELSSVCQHLGMKCKDIPHINKSDHKFYREYYDAEMRGHVAKHFEPEIKMLGYSF